MAAVKKKILQAARGNKEQWQAGFSKASYLIADTSKSEGCQPVHYPHVWSCLCNSQKGVAIQLALLKLFGEQVFEQSAPLELKPIYPQVLIHKLWVLDGLSAYL